MTFLKRLAMGASVTTLTLMAASAVYAQQTTAAVGGIAVDDQNKPIAGATITVTHVPTGTKLRSVTDASGVFSFRGLRVGGPYTVSASAKDFDNQTITDMFLNVGDDSRVKLSLAPSGNVSELVVTATKSLTGSQLANVGSRTTLQAAQIEAVVSVRRDVRDVARRDPLANLDLVSRSTGPSGGLYIAGSSPRRNRITIDGVRSQDDFGLNTGGLSTNRGPISLEAVEQVSIQATPFDVEEGDFTGGALNLILKSGSNDFHGSVFGFFRSPSLVGSTLPGWFATGNSFPGSDLRNGLTVKDVHITNYIHEKNYGGFISGPIWKDRLFFAASYEKFTSFDLTPAGPAGGGFGTTFNPLGATVVGGAIVAATPANPILATQANIDAITGLFKSPTFAGSFAPGTVSLAEPITDQKYSVKLDFNVTNDQRLAFTYRHADSSVWKRSPSSTNIYLDTDWYIQPEVEDNYALQLNSTWTPEFTTEGRISYRNYTRGQNPPEGQGFANLQICTDATSSPILPNSALPFACSSGVPTIQIGPDQFRQANVLATTDWAGEFVANYRLGDSHRLKFGYQYKGIHIYDLFVQAAHGVYYFDSVTDFSKGIATQVNFGGAVSGKLTDAAENFGYQAHTLLAQDTWDINENLTVNYGLRVDIYKQSDKPTLNQAFTDRYGFSNQKTYDGQVVWQPRFSAKYRTQSFELSGGLGRVSGGIPDVFIGNSYGAQTGALSGSVTIKRTPVTGAAPTGYTDSSNNPFPTALGDALLGSATHPLTGTFDTSTPASLQSLISTTSSSVARLAFTNSLAPNFKMPADWKANISFKTTKLGLDWGVDAVYTRSDTNVAFRDLRARLLTIGGQQAYTPDGRLRYDGLVIDPAIRAASGLPTSTNPDLASSVSGFGDIQAYNPGKQNWAATVAFSVGKQWKGFDAFLSYTYQDAKTYGGISEFGTTAGGGGGAATGNYYSDQGSYLDPNATVYGKAPNLMRDSWKLDLSYKMELVKGFTSRFTLFAESHSGRPLSFLMTDPTTNTVGHNPTFGVYRDDQMAFIPQMTNQLTAIGGTQPVFVTPNAGAPGGSTTVIFDSAATLDKFRTLVNQFGLPIGGVIPRGFGQNPQVNRVDFQFAQEFPSPIKGHELLFTMDISNLGNLLNHNWGVVREYGGLTSRAGTPIINAQCADATTGAISGQGSTVCTAYKYTYTTANATTAVTPIVDPQASQWSIQFGLKYKF